MSRSCVDNRTTSFYYYYYLFVPLFLLVLINFCYYRTSFKHYLRGMRVSDFVLGCYRMYEEGRIYCNYVLVTTTNTAPWYDHTVAVLRRQRRRAERRWRRLRSDYTAARRAVGNQILLRKVEFYGGQVASCKGDQKKL